ncbi:cation diffusion facilitator family transporter [Candidatus Xianfuyuplasma coldseepsis]|uniref:Cation transporter n=1 Tax=Candidatus Xianfuyuplasma coldseepsis TaxID=2782163 RepID=A0A7L7KSH1_9MOLU|nr:cation diffusion facilitator family transporter [Xianfuyuplasma coldseepsis]QMS85545.1 cation transporter [Xianfuyuplasma coldseepsis]
MNHEHIMRKSLYVNVFLVFMKIVSGFFFNSVALIADGVHSISDLLSDIFVVLGIRHSIKPADEDHPFGHGKFEYVLSLLLGLSIITIAYNLGKNVITNWSNAIEVPNGLTMVIIVVVIGLKLILARYLIRKGQETGSEIIQASGQESFSDVISSAVVFIGVGGVLLGHQLDIDWLLYGDKVASFIIALFIIRIGIIIVLEAIKSIQGKTVGEEICQEYKESIAKIDGVHAVDQLDMIAYGPYYQAIVEIKVDGTKTVKEGHDIAHLVHETLLKNEKICHVSVHVNPGGKL